MEVEHLAQYFRAKQNAERLHGASILRVGRIGMYSPKRDVLVSHVYITEVRNWTALTIQGESR